MVLGKQLEYKMPLSSETKPDHTTDTGSAYKTNIDNIISDIADTPAPDAVEAKHSKAANTQISDGSSGSSNLFDVDGTLTVDTWKTIGPTGSPGIDHAFFMLDDLPAGAGILLATLYVEMGTTGSGPARTILYARDPALSTSPGNTSNMIAFKQIDFDAAVANAYVDTSIVMIPLDSDHNFDLRYSNTAGTTDLSIFLYYRGFISNGG